MKRRTLLAAAAAAVAGTAGCLSSASDTPAGDADPTDDPTRTPTRDPTTTPGGDPTATPDDPTSTPDDPASTPGEGPFAGCPSFVPDADRTVCYYDRGDSDVYLEPSAREFLEYGEDDEVQTLTLTLHNDAGEPFGLNPYAWEVRRWSDGEWVHVAPDEVVEPWYEVPPGGTYEWILSTEQHSSSMSENSMAVVVDLESAEHYAFGVNGLLGSGDAEERIECLARFEYLLAVPAVGAGNH